VAVWYHLHAELQVANYFLQFFEAALAAHLPIEQNFSKVIELVDGKTGLHCLRLELQIPGEW